MNQKTFSRLIIFTALLLPFGVAADEVASLYSAEGKVEGQQTSNAKWQAASVGQKFEDQSSVRTLARSRAAVKFNDGYLVRLSAQTTMKFSNVAKDQGNRPVNVASGKVYFFSRKPQTFPLVTTPHVSASVRGTEFVVEVTKGETVISVLDGAVTAKNKLGEVDLGKNEQAVTKAGQAPVKQIMVHPENAVQWALYYPQVLIAQDMKGAKASAETAQQALVQLVHNNRAEARRLINDSLGKSRTATGLLVLSYVEQGDFDMEQARDALAEAEKLAPTDPLILARRAEIELGFGDKDAAKQYVAKSLSSDPNNVYALTVRGFIHLTLYKTDLAIAAFDRAIMADSSFSLAYLGRGLALIRKGELGAGREELQKAVHLDPQVASYRSYLGKAYYEEERSDLSRGELARAIDIDPNDPTPYLYRSFLDLEEHQPIAALEDLQESVAKNDERGVYRSRLLLDLDQGTRSAGLGRIYNRLGFKQLSRVEAMNSLGDNYGNYSAHFLLAQLYDDTHLNSRAQTTENIVGRLLSPVNFNANSLSLGGDATLNEYTTLFDRPVNRTNVEAFAKTQSETYGGVVEQTYSDNKLGVNFGYQGTSRHGFRDNDFARDHQLFNLGQYQLGDKDTLVWDSALTLNDQGDLNVGFDPYSEDTDLKTGYDAFLGRVGWHRDLGPGAHLVGQAFYQYGDFYTHDNGVTSRLPFLNITEGGSLVTGSPFDFTSSANERLKSRQHLGRADLQLIKDTHAVSVIAGVAGKADRTKSLENGSVTDVGGEDSLSSLLGFPLSTNNTIEEHSEQAYLYTTWHLAPWVDLTAGGAFTHLEQSENAFTAPFVDDTYDKTALDPKLGAIIRVTPQTTLRAAFFKTLDRTGAGGIDAIEPTFVGGFNQVIDGVAGSAQKVAGLGIDHKISSKTYVGASYTRRELELLVPYTAGGLTLGRDTGAAAEQNFSSTDSGGADIDRLDMYLYQILTDRLSGTFDYGFERFVEDSPLPESVTYRGGLQLNYFMPSGIFAFSRGTYRYQEISGDLLVKDTESFFIVDAGVGYEFAHRHGGISLQLNNIFDQDFNYSHIEDEFAVRPEFGAELVGTYNF